jgi:predicted TPR repeat methyltransferase
MDGEAVVEEDCDKLTALEFEFPNQYRFRATFLRHWCDRTPTALADYTTVIEMAPSWADPYFERALLHETEDDLDHAVEDMEKAVELAPNWKEAVGNLTRLREKEGSKIDE